MKRRASFLGILIWICCLILSVWSLALPNIERFHRNLELQQVEASLDQLRTRLADGAVEQSFLTGAVHNLRVMQDGAVLLEKHHVLALAMFAIGGLGLVTLLLVHLQRIPEALAGVSTVVAESKAPVKECIDTYLSNLEATAEDLQKVCSDLGTFDTSQTLASTRASSFGEAQFDQILRIESHLLRLRMEMTHATHHMSEVTKNMQRLTSLCEENAHFGAATRLEWNTMGRKLRQINEEQDRIKSTGEKITKQQTICSDLVSKTLDFGSSHSKHSEVALESIQRMHDISRSTLGTLDLLTHSMAESNQDVGTASTLVRGLSERAEEIVNIIDVIDDIAEQTNQLALNASIEAARAGEQGQGFAVVAAEVRNLAARSSTATKSITDLLGTIQQEADQASASLENSRKSVALAHSRLLEVDRSYREAVSLSRQSLAKLKDLIAEVSTHMQDLKVIEKQNAELKKHCATFHHQLDEHGRLTSVTQTESSQLTSHSDRLSRLLNRQYFEMSHCDRLLEATLFSLEDMKQRIDEGIASSEALRSIAQQSYHRSLQKEPSSQGRGDRMARIVTVLDACRKNLELITASPDSLRRELGESYRPLAETEGARAEHLPAEPSLAQVAVAMPPDDVLIGVTSDSQKAS